jgi:hypothetical protein
LAKRNIKKNPEQQHISVEQVRVRKPLKVLSTSLGIILAANLLLLPAAHAEGSSEPKLVEWSNENVKKFFDANTDWNIPLPQEKKETAGNGTGSAGSTGGGSPAPVVYHSGLNWTDLMLYHMIFNSGGPYSSSGWSSQRPVYDTRTSRPYVSKTYDSSTFQNKPTANSTVVPKTSSSKGGFKTKSSLNNNSSSGSKSKSSSPGGIGGKSSGFGSSGKSSGSSFGS